MFDKLGAGLGRFLERDRPVPSGYVSQDFDALCATVRVGDVLLVEGRSRISTAIKYLTQSTWSHAALCVADTITGDTCELVEVTLQDGCHRISIGKYAGFNTRLCRPAGLSDSERRTVARYMADRVGMRYDLRNVWDLARFLFPTPPIPVRFRRRMLAFGSGDPTRAICSSLIARAFQSIRYPILPEIRLLRAGDAGPGQRREVWHIRHHSLFVPRDFDLSPYFAVVKPTLVSGFDHRRIRWAPADGQAGSTSSMPDSAAAPRQPTDGAG